MLCAYCEIPDIPPESIAGLCVSCITLIRSGQLCADWGEGEIYLCATRKAIVDADPKVYEPASLLPLDTPNEFIADMKEELLSLAVRERPQSFSARARAVIDDIRQCHVEVEIDYQNSLVVISEPRRVPYPILCAFIELQAYIFDELMREDGFRIEESQERWREIENRYREEERSHDAI